MKIPVNWLKEYVDFDLSAEKLAEKLTLSGSEVDEILGGANFKNVAVGEILEIKKHPNADKLHICQIDVGEKKPRQIICGSLFTVDVGDKVPVALASTKVGHLKIEKSKLRGVESYGMICSDEELGIEGGGLTFFDKRVKNGTDINKIFGASAVLDIDLTPNRSDCYSIIGMARETAATLGIKSKIEEPKAVKTQSDKKMKVEIQDKDLCPRYIAKVIEGVTIAPSPDWMQKRLIASGIRPINNVVDVTNYVLLEWGQPLHAFDLDKLAGNKIIVRKAKNKERIETLDDTFRELDPKDLVIADTSGPIAVAGVMGGASTEVSSRTKNIVLESANFDRVSIRKTAQKLKLRSESSSRFEKGLPLHLQEVAIERAAQLILESAGGEAGENVEVISGQVEVETVKMDIKKFEKFAGIKIPAKQILSILASLGFECKQTGDTLSAKVPWWRLDASIPEDLYEEIARIYGYNNMPSTLPEGEIPLPDKNLKLEMLAQIKELLVGAGLSEVINYSFTSRKNIDLLSGAENTLKITNPISPEWAYMRAGLTGSLLENIALNQDNYGNIQIFEVSNVYLKDKDLFQEKNLLGIGISGSIKNGSLFFSIKGILELIAEKLNVKDIKLEVANIQLLEAGRSASIIADGRVIGYAGEVSDQAKKFFGIKHEAAVLEIDIQLLLKSFGNAKQYEPFSKFPVSERDLTIVFDEEVKISKILKVIDSLNVKILVKRKVADIYRGKELGSGKKAVSVGLIYQSKERTLEEQEIEKAQKEIIKKVKEKVGGKVRGEKDS